MSQRIADEAQLGYMDGVCVKISEKYKPPPRINPAFSFSHRNPLINQIPNNNSYDFCLEINVKDKVKELRNARKLLYEEKKERLAKVKEIWHKFEKDKLKKDNENKSCTDLQARESNNLDTANVSKTLNVSPSNVGAVYSTSYSHILTPTPLSYSNAPQAINCKPNDESPFNISDFEADTSSPFDNMELKTINDIEELAQVLKKDEKSGTTYNIPYTATQIYTNYVPLPSISTYSNTPSTFTAQETHNTNSHYASYIPHSYVTSYGQQPSGSTVYSNLNGYYHADMLPANQKYGTYNYDNFKSDNSSGNSPPYTSENNKISSFRSVPDIMKALETELTNTHINKLNDNSTVENNQKKSMHMKKLEDDEKVIKPVEVDNVYELLPKHLQELSKSISFMGFPLSRVARACQAIGNDHKKIVEYLLTMSELLDLGFAEKDVSKALLLCNNDRDKALDMLIS